MMFWPECSTYLSKNIKVEAEIEMAKSAFISMNIFSKYFYLFFYEIEIFREKNVLSTI